MPIAAPRKCTMVGCGQFVSDRSGRCADHQYRKWNKSEQSVKRITGRRLQADRERLFSADPLCANCKKHGRVTAATQRDHIVPLAEGGQDVDENVQGLCDDCHKEKSLQEAKRGRARRKNEWGGVVKVRR